MYCNFWTFNILTAIDYFYIALALAVICMALLILHQNYSQAIWDKLVLDLTEHDLCRLRIRLTPSEYAWVQNEYDLMRCGHSDGLTTVRDCVRDFYVRTHIKTSKL
jgi:hypothetical protein